MVMLYRVVAVTVQCGSQIFLEAVRMSMLGNEHRMFLHGLEQ